MYKHLFRTALGLMGIMGALSIGVVSADGTGCWEGKGTVPTSTYASGIVYGCDGSIPIITIYGDNGKGITIKAMNEGATAIGAKNNNIGSYGNSYQWGNNHGFPFASGKNDINISTNTSTQVDVSNYGPVGKSISGYYDSGTWIPQYQWSTDNRNLWGGSGDEKKLNGMRGFNTGNFTVTNSGDRRGMCPEGYHIPSEGEWSALLYLWGKNYNTNQGTSLFNWSLDRLNYKNSLNGTGNRFSEDMQIPFVRSRYYDGTVNAGDYGYYWSSSPSNDTHYARRFYLGASRLYADDDIDRGYGYAVRCFKNSYVEPPQTSTSVQLTFAVSDNNGETSASTGVVESGTEITLSTGDYVATKEGWTHIGWNTDASSTGVLESITMTEDTTVYAIFSKDLTVNYATGAGVSTIQKESDSCSVYNTGTSCTLTVPDITEDEGYENGAWEKGNDTVNPGEDITLTSDGDTYTATASAKEFAIRFVDSNQQNGDVIHSGAYKSDTSNITYPSWTKDGYTISWDKPIPPTMPLNGDTITANWTENKKPSGGSSGGGGRSKTDTDMQKEDKASTDSSAQFQKDNQSTQDSQQSEQVSANVSEGQNYSEEFQEAYKFAYEKGITTMPTINDANMKGKLTRIAMAKMLSYYAINVLGQKPDETRNNKFNDVSEKLDVEYNNAVTLAYQLGIMGINVPNNNFRPNDEVTRAEFATALSRMLYSTPDGKPYYVTHLEKLKAEGILTNDDYKMKELRGYVMIMLKRSAK